LVIAQLVSVVAREAVRVVQVARRLRLSIGSIVLLADVLMREFWRHSARFASDNEVASHSKPAAVSGVACCGRLHPGIQL
jgi:hypothetical protein